MKIERLSKTFGRAQVLAAVDLEIDRSEIHALVGPNGAGKSTLIKILTGYHVPDSGGEIHIAGQPLAVGSAADSHRAGIRWVHQGRSVVEAFNAVDNIGLLAGFERSQGRIDWAAQRRITVEQLSRLGIEVDIDRPLREIGALRRTAVAIAGALARTDSESHLLILDEPTATLPDWEVERLFEILRGLRETGIGILYVSHRLDEILELADRVSVLRDGRIVMRSDVANLAHDHLVLAISGKSTLGADKPGRKDPARRRAPVLSVHGLRTQHVKSVDLVVGEGEILGLAGLAGSGREDVLGVLAHTIDGTVDDLIVSGKSVQPTIKGLRDANVVFIPGNRQRGSFVPQFSVRENLTLPSLMEYRRRGSVDVAAERADTRRWIEVTDLRPPDPEQRFALLSGGNQQKAILAKWLQTSPRVALLDDPTAGVDVGTREAIFDLVFERANAGVAFVVSSADEEELARLCSRVLVLARGRVVEELVGDRVSEFEIVRASTGGIVGTRIENG